MEVLFLLFKLYMFGAFSCWMLTLWYLYFDGYETVATELEKIGTKRNSPLMHFDFIVGSMLAGIMWLPTLIFGKK